MKKLTLLFICSLLLFSCKKEKDTIPFNEHFDTTNATLISQASFSSNAHSVSGTVKLYLKNGVKNLVFENLKADDGPDLKAYMSTTTGNSDYASLGELKSTTGTFYYTVDSTINTSTHNYVLIWCEAHSVLFGNAHLQ